MDIDRELLPATTPSRLLPTASASRVPDEAVPMLAFLVGAARAAVALVRFCVAVVRDGAPDPIGIEPRILRSY